MPGNALISEGIKDILVSAGIGVFQPSAGSNDWHIIISRIKPNPDKMIVIYDTAGLPPEPGLDINYPGIQIVVRGMPNGYKDTSVKSKRIKDEFLGMPKTTVNGDIWASVTMTSDIIWLGYDENERPSFSLNFQLIVHQGDLANSHREAT
jgi:Bacteriophage minor capsid protein